MEGINIIDSSSYAPAVDVSFDTSQSSWFDHTHTTHSNYSNHGALDVNGYLPSIPDNGTTMPTITENNPDGNLEGNSDAMPVPEETTSGNSQSDPISLPQDSGLHSFFSVSSLRTIRPKVFRTSRDWLSKRLSWRTNTPMTNADSIEKRHTSDSIQHQGDVAAAFETGSTYPASLTSPLQTAEPENKRKLTLSNMLHLRFSKRAEANKDTLESTNSNSIVAPVRPERPPQNLCPDPSTNLVSGDGVRRHVRTGALVGSLGSPDTVDTMTALRERWVRPKIGLGTWTQRAEPDARERQVQSPHSEHKSFVSSLDLAKAVSDASTSAGKSTNRYQHIPVTPEQQITKNMSPSPLRIRKVRPQYPDSLSMNNRDEQIHQDVPHRAFSFESVGKRPQTPIMAVLDDLRPPYPVMAHDASLSSSAASTPYKYNRVFTGSNSDAETDAASVYTDMSIADSVADNDMNILCSEETAMDATDRTIKSLLSLLSTEEQAQPASDVEVGNRKSSPTLADARRRAIVMDASAHLPIPVQGYVCDSLPRRTMIPKPISSKNSESPSCFVMSAIITGRERQYIASKTRSALEFSKPQQPIATSLNLTLCESCLERVSWSQNSLSSATSVQRSQADAQTQTEIRPRRRSLRLQSPSDSSLLRYQLSTTSVPKLAASKRTTSSELSVQSARVTSRSFLQDGKAMTNTQGSLGSYTAQAGPSKGHQSRVSPRHVNISARSSPADRHPSDAGNGSGSTPLATNAPDLRSFIAALHERRQRGVGQHQTSRHIEEVGTPAADDTDAETKLPQLNPQKRPIHQDEDLTNMEPGTWMKGSNVVDKATSTRHSKGKMKDESYTQSISDHDEDVCA